MKKSHCMKYSLKHLSRHFCRISAIFRRSVAFGKVSFRRSVFSAKWFSASRTLNFPPINFQSCHMGNKEKHEGGIVLILKSAWGVLSTLYYWAWGVLSAFKKTCGGFCPPITKWTWGVMSVGCFVHIPQKSCAHAKI